MFSRLYLRYMHGSSFAKKTDWIDVAYGAPASERCMHGSSSLVWLVSKNFTTTRSHEPFFSAASMSWVEVFNVYG